MDGMGHSMRGMKPESFVYSRSSGLLSLSLTFAILSVLGWELVSGSNECCGKFLGSWCFSIPGIAINLRFIVLFRSISYPRQGYNRERDNCLVARLHSKYFCFDPNPGTVLYLVSGVESMLDHFSNLFQSTKHPHGCIPAFCYCILQPDMTVEGQNVSLDRGLETSFE